MKAFSISKVLVTVVWLLNMEDCETVLSEIRFLIPFQVLLKIFRLILTKCVKWKHLLLFSNVDIRFLYCLYLMWISFFWLLSFHFINFANKMLIKMGFCKPKVIHSLHLTYSFFFVTFLSGVWFFKMHLLSLKIIKRKI